MAGPSLQNGSPTKTCDVQTKSPRTVLRRAGLVETFSCLHLDISPISRIKRRTRLPVTNIASGRSPRRDPARAIIGPSQILPIDQGLIARSASPTSAGLRYRWPTPFCSWLSTSRLISQARKSMWTAELSPYSRYREATLVVEPAIVALDRDGLPLDCATKACAGDGVKDDVIHGQRLHQRHRHRVLPRSAMRKSPCWALSKASPN
jgi:hypothetical protein